MSNDSSLVVASVAKQSGFIRRLPRRFTPRNDKTLDTGMRRYDGMGEAGEDEGV